MPPTRVDDSEDVYRAIRSGSDEYVYIGGKIEFSSVAFADRNFAPSVDRSSMCILPRYAKKNATDGVAKLGVRQVRSICDIPVAPDPKGNGEQKFAVDVVHAPIQNHVTDPDNLAHCQVECDPTIGNNSRFKRLREALARIATQHGFVVAPT